MRLIIHDLSDMDKPPVQEDENTVIICNNKKINCCVGCFGCWIKTPGKCIIKDSYNNMGELLSKCDELIIISKCCYGSYSPFIKNVLDRGISYILPYFTIRNNEVHHKSRYPNKLMLNTIFYGEEITENEKKTARALVKGNAINFNAKTSNIYFKENIIEIGGLINEICSSKLQS